MGKTKWTAAVLLSAAVLTGLPTLPAATTHAASVQNQTYTGIVIKSVNLRTDPSTSASVIELLRAGEKLTQVTESGSYWYKVTTSSGVTGYASSAPEYIQVTPVSGGNPSGSVQTGEIVYGVNLRTAPSTSSQVIRLLKKGEKVQITGRNDNWYQVITENGESGYMSSSSQYVQISSDSGSGGNNNTGGSPSNGNNGSGNTTPRDQLIQKVFQVGRSYLGTPYEFGSDRNNNATFDCSDFTRTVYREATGIILPADSRQQGDWVKQNSKAVSNINSLKPGDLMFFMSYKGSSDAAYQGIDKSKERITHVGIYMGNGQIMQTYSVQSGGVRIDNLTASWERRFLFGGSVL